MWDCEKLSKLPMSTTPCSPDNSLESLPGLGPRSAAQLRSVGISNRQELITAGAIPVYLRLKTRYPRTSLNFLYALTGAVENCHWQDVARNQREVLLQQLEGARALADLFNSQQDSLKP